MAKTKAQKNVALLEVRDLTVELPTPGGAVRPVQEVSLSIGRGESLGLVGESGSGKTMLALALVGLLPRGARRSGQAWLGGHDGAEATDLVPLGASQLTGIRGREIGFVFQEPMTALNPVMRVGAQNAEAIRAHEPRLPAAKMMSNG